MHETRSQQIQLQLPVVVLRVSSPRPKTTAPIHTWLTVIVSQAKLDCTSPAAAYTTHAYRYPVTTSPSSRNRVCTRFTPLCLVFGVFVDVFVFADVFSNVFTDVFVFVDVYVLVYDNFFAGVVVPAADVDVVVMSIWLLFGLD